MSAQATAEMPDSIEPVPTSVELLVNLCSAIDSLDGWERHQELVTFARSSIFHPASLMLEGMLGAIHREAWVALKQDANADTPGLRWERAGHVRGRESIKRFLAAEDWPVYATIPFRTVDTDEGPRIGAAIGGERLLAAKRSDPWAYLDITDVVLWDPATNGVSVDGDRGAAHLIQPSGDNEFYRLKVYRDPLAFFRDWVLRRVEVLRVHQVGHHQLETRDGCLPGALAIGDIDRIPWSCVSAAVIVAGPGMDRSDLARAVRRSYRIPPVMEATHDDAR